MKKIVFQTILLLALIPCGYSMGMELRLTGNPIPSSFVQKQIEEIFENMYGLKANSQRFPMFDLHPYQKKKLKVSLSLSNGALQPLDVTVTSEKISPSREPLLLFSNHPETLTENGLLFSAGMIFLRPVRLNYYHENGPGQPPRAVVIRIDNKNDEPALVHILEARSGPSKDEISTGHKASLMFLQRHSKTLGRIETIPANDYLVISRQIANPGELVTGFIEAKELKGHPLQIAVFAEDPKEAMHKHDLLLESHDTHARGAYEMSRLVFNVRHQVGETPKIISLGDLPLKNLLPGQPLKGAYGMLWEGEIELHNPFTTVEKIPIYFQPRGGAASATFVINDFYKELAATKSYESPLLLEVNLSPKSTQYLHVLTMPEGGSSYPIQLIIGRTNQP